LLIIIQFGFDNLVAILSIEYEKQKICSLLSVSMNQLIATDILYFYLQMDVSGYLALRGNGDVYTDCQKIRHWKISHRRFITHWLSLFC